MRTRVWNPLSINLHTVMIVIYWQYQDTWCTYNHIHYHLHNHTVGIIYPSCSDSGSHRSTSSCAARHPRLCRERPRVRAAWGAAIGVLPQKKKKNISNFNFASYLSYFFFRYSGCCFLKKKWQFGGTKTEDHDIGSDLFGEILTAIDLPFGDGSWHS